MVSLLKHLDHAFRLQMSMTARGFRIRLVAFRPARLVLIQTTSSMLVWPSWLIGLIRRRLRGGGKQAWKLFPRIKKDWRKPQGVIFGKRCGSTQALQLVAVLATVARAFSGNAHAI